MTSIFPEIVSESHKKTLKNLIEEENKGALVLQRVGVTPPRLV